MIKPNLCITCASFLLTFFLSTLMPVIGFLIEIHERSFQLDFLVELELEAPALFIRGMQTTN